jgi:imidazole glycerol-phosphate synthase subunit HisH
LIVIIDYNAGNIKSIQNMLKRIGVKSIISNQKEDIENAEKIILPGVGSFDYGMSNLKNTGLVDILNKKVINDKIPFLGICLGAQMLGSKSDEGVEQGLGWINMNIIKFNIDKMPVGYKIPHMNWNEIEIQKTSKLLEGLNNESRFYFVHSYYMQPENSENTLTLSTYGEKFTSSVQKDNIYGVQFHPEKSHKYGMKILENFANL